MQYNLSICVPSYHPEKIPQLLFSISKNYHKNFELIICGPNVSNKIENFSHLHLDNSYDNINDRLIYIQDFGSPARCCNIAAERATGKYITFIADDATYLNMSIARAIIKMDKWAEKDHVVICKYVEGNMPWWMMTLEWGQPGYTIQSAYGRYKYIHPDWWHFNSAYYHTSYFKEMGGYDSAMFETPHWASTDLAARCQKNGCTLELMDEPCFVVTHNPNNQGTHEAICQAHNTDEQVFKAIYDHTETSNLILRKVPFDNWKNASEKWIRR